ncbi:MAG TPA: hypothetical protein PLF31_02780 [Candidatus Paceibacterota bacterium]|nr:hypothetical protein [Candidatus Paceibacterota bacterium]
MKGISDYFKKFTFILSKDQAVKNVVSETIRGMFLIDLEKKDFYISNGVLIIKTHPVIRQKILSRKKAVLDALRAKGTDIWNIS